MLSPALGGRWRPLLHDAADAERCSLVLVIAVKDLKWILGVAVMTLAVRRSGGKLPLGWRYSCLPCSHQSVR